MKFITKQIFFNLIIGATFLGALFFGVLSGIEIYQYVSLTHQAKVEIIDYTPISKKGRYHVQVLYSYRVGNKDYFKKEVLPEFYLNTYAARDGFEKDREDYKRIWYNPHRPMRGSLIRTFPFNHGIRALVGIGIFIYFCYLKNLFDKKEY